MHLFTSADMDNWIPLFCPLNKGFFFVVLDNLGFCVVDSWPVRSISYRKEYGLWFSIFEMKVKYSTATFMHRKYFWRFFLIQNGECDYYASKHVIWSNCWCFSICNTSRVPLFLKSANPIKPCSEKYRFFFT